MFRTQHAPSLTLRISVVFAIGAAISIGILGHWLYWTLDREIERQNRESLAGYVNLVRHFIANAEAGEQTIVNRHFLHYLALALGGRKLRVSLYDDSGNLLVALNGPPVPSTVVPSPVALEREPTEFRDWASPDEKRSFQTVSAWASTAQGEKILAVLAHDMSAFRALSVSYHRTTLVSMLLAALFAAALGFGLSRRALAPVREIAAATDRISTQELKQRLHLETAPRELRQLASAFNRMLDRLEDSFARISQFSSDLAHELRTPIQNLMVQTQVVLSRTRSAEEYRSVLESNSEEYERLSQMIEQMLFLAYADSATAELERIEFDAGREIAQLRDFFEPVADERRITVECVGQASAYANPLLFRRALSNILSNALRHTPDGGTVRIAVERLATGQTQVAFTNSGPGIPAQHLSRLFDRFYRVESARGHAVGGSGLGLAIVKSIMDLHHGVASVESTADSTTVRLIFPPGPRHRQPA